MVDAVEKMLRVANVGAVVYSRVDFRVTRIFVNVASTTLFVVSHVVVQIADRRIINWVVLTVYADDT